MHYFDDILNVYAYLQSQMQEQAGTIGSLAQQTFQLHKDIDRTAADIHSLEQDTDRFLNNAIALAGKMGIDISDILAVEESAPEISGVPAIIAKNRRIEFPKDYDFEHGFEKLVQEAHAAGFTDVHPEQLLTDEEIANALAFSEQLDEEFAKTTRLQNKDIPVLIVATVTRVIVYYLKLFLISTNHDTSTDNAPNNQPPGIKPDASMGVDMSEVLKKNNPRFSISDAAQILNGTSLNLSDIGLSSPLSICEESQILRRHSSFDVEETDFLSRDQILGYDKYLGWLFGVANILTDTVTSKSFKSYTVSRLPDETAKPLVDREVSTLFQVVYPTIQSLKNNKEAVIASVVREAKELGIADTKNDSVLELYNRALALEHKSSDLISQSRQMVLDIWEQADQYLDNIVFNSLVNTIIAAAHSLMYRSNDGDLSQYALRTNKIILYSSSIATIINSMPALLIEDPTQIDFGGIISSLLSLFHMTSFWIDVKANFLVNAYRKELSPYIDQLNKEFDFV